MEQPKRTRHDSVDPDKLSYILDMLEELGHMAASIGEVELADRIALARRAFSLSDNNLPLE